MSHGNDNAKPGTRLTSCGTCLREFPGKTPQESADLARAHVEAGCQKARGMFAGPRIEAVIIPLDTPMEAIPSPVAPPPFKLAVVSPDDPEMDALWR